MDSSEINYTNWEHAPTRLGHGPEGWFLVLDNEGERRPHHEREHRLIGPKDIERLIAFYELMVMAKNPTGDAEKPVGKPNEPVAKGSWRDPGIAEFHGS